MEIKEIRDFKILPIEEKKEKLQATKKVLNFARVLQYGSVIGTGLCGYDLINDLYKGGSVTEGPSVHSFVFLGLFCLAINLKRVKYTDFIQQDTIINLEENELTREKTL